MSGHGAALSRWAAVALALALAGAFVQAQEAWRAADVSRVVVVADVHGAYPAFVELLQATSIVDAELKWSGGDTHLVSLGDLLDRGPESRPAMELVMRLQEEAKAQGGRVHFVAGNHELMNLMGDLRYVSAGEYAAFAPDETAAERASALQEIAAFANSGVTTDELDAAYPAGYFAHRAAFRADGRYGSWLLTQPMIVVVNGTAFVHGGLPRSAGSASLAELNERYQDALRRYLALRDELAATALLPPYDMQGDTELASRRLESLQSHPELEELLALTESAELGVESPLWYRGSVYCKPLLEDPVLDAALTGLGAERVVVGHTPTDNRRVQARHEGKLIVLDTGMLASYYNGRPAALVFEAGQVSVEYTHPRQTEPLDLRPYAAYGLVAEELVAALTGGEVTIGERAATSWRVAVNHGGGTLEAVFIPGDPGHRELAAARLDDLLGTELVPLTVPRSLEDQEGALQLVYPGAISETDRLARQLGIGAWCPIEPQVELMFVFDALIANRGRGPDNILFADDLSNVVLTAHGNAFGTERSLPANFDPNSIGIPAPLIDALRGLDEAQLETELGAWLDRRSIRGLLARRDRILDD